MSLNIRGRALQEFYDTQAADERFFQERSLELLAKSYSEIFAKDALSSENMSLQSLSDLIRGGSKSVKREVIGRLKRRFSRDSVVLLRVAQRDPDYEICYLATQALAYFEKRWLNEVKLLSSYPDVAKPSPQELYNLIESLMIAYRTGLMDPEVTYSHIQIGRKLMQAAVESNPDNTYYWRQLGKIHLQENLLEKAIFCFDQAMVFAPDWFNGWFWKAEAYFMQSDFPGVKRCCQELVRRCGGSDKLPDEIREQVLFWLEQNFK